MPVTAVQISHDGFARTSLMRQLIPPLDRSPCRWCYREARFVYYIERDDRPGYTNNIRGRFCTVECMRSYHS